MSNQAGTQARTFRIQIRKYKGSDLLLATSEDLRGLNVIGRTDQEIDDRVPGSVREMLEAQGHHVVSVTAQHAEDGSNFIRRDLIATAELEAA